MEFSYSALENPAYQIRLLHIEPGGEDGPIFCTLSQYDINTAPEYTAVSYTWGDVSPRSEITINGCIMRARQNCLYALSQLRQLPCETFHFWLDAICIDQQDLEEKSYQVQMM